MRRVSNRRALVVVVACVVVGTLVIGAGLRTQRLDLGPYGTTGNLITADGTTGSLTALGGFEGPGGSLTGLNASELATGTVPAERLPGYGQTLIVAKSGGQYSSIQAAVDAATTGDTVLIYPGEYLEYVEIHKGISLRGVDRNSVIIRRDVNTEADVETNCVIWINEANVTIENLTAQNYAADWGPKGCVVLVGHWTTAPPATATDCVFRNCTFDAIGRDTMLIWDGSDRTLIQGCQLGGSLDVVSFRLTDDCVVEGCDFLYQNGAEAGAAVYASGCSNLRITNCTTYKHSNLLNLMGDHGAVSAVVENVVLEDSRGAAFPYLAYASSGEAHTVRYRNVSFDTLKLEFDTASVACTPVLLPVIDGGTGVATLAAGNLPLGAGTSAMTALAPGTAGNVCRSNGSTWASFPRVLSQLTPSAELLSTSGTAYGFRSFDKYLDIPANKITDGSVVRIFVCGKISSKSTSAAGVYTKILLGSESIAASSAVAINAMTDAVWYADVTLICTTAGNPSVMHALSRHAVSYNGNCTRTALTGSTAGALRIQPQVSWANNTNAEDKATLERIIVVFE